MHLLSIEAEGSAIPSASIESNQCNLMRVCILVLEPYLTCLSFPYTRTSKLANSRWFLESLLYRMASNVCLLEIDYCQNDKS